LESNWRYQVAEWGLSNVGIRLAARLVTPVGIRDGVVLFTNGLFRYLTISTGTSGAPAIGGNAPKTPGITGFPFGNEVYPD